MKNKRVKIEEVKNRINDIKHITDNQKFMCGLNFTITCRERKTIDALDAYEIMDRILPDYISGKEIWKAVEGSK